MALPSSGVKNRFFRVYDGDSTPHYVQYFQMEQVALPTVVPRPTTAIMLDGGRATQYMSSYIEDEAVPFQPIEFTARVLHLSQSLQLVTALGNPWSKSPWTVGAHTWVGQATNAIGTRLNSDGTAIAAVPPRDAIQVNRMVSLVWGYTVPTDAAGGTAFYCKCDGVVVTNVRDVPDGVNMFFEITAQIYGGVNPLLTAFPAGIESTPA